MPLCAVTVVSTFSRGGFLAMAAATATYVALHRRRVGLSGPCRDPRNWYLPSVAPIPEGYFDRLETIRHYEERGESLPSVGPTSGVAPWTWRSDNCLEWDSETTRLHTTGMTGHTAGIAN